MSNDYYIILGLSKGADLNQIKRAYRKIAKKYHPDMTPSEAESEKFLEVKEAYETLIDEKKRSEYDQELAKQKISPHRVTRVSEKRRKRRSLFDEKEFFSSSMDEFFEGFLPGFFHKEPGKPPEKDIYLEVILSSREAREGGLFPITVPVLEPCPRCSKSSIWDGFFCSVCFGHGRIESERQFSLAIPPNTKHETSITLPMEDIGLKGVDLHIFVRVDPAMDRL